MKLFTAMILSSRSQAERYFHQGGGLIATKRYRLLATHLPGENTEDKFDLSIYLVTYPQAQQGKGRGEPVIADMPHKTFRYPDLDAFHADLEKIGIDHEEGWTPVENGDQEI